MTNCAGKRKLISRLIDKDLPSDESDLIKAHCIECVKCSIVYKSYLKTQNLIKECYSDESVHHVMPLRTTQMKVGFLSRFTTIKVLSPIGASIVTFAIVLFMFLANPFHNKQTVPLLVENCASLMNTPLGSLAYYEELDGTTVQSQFTKLSAGPSDVSDKSVDIELQYLSYSSPLFYDTGIDGENYFQSANSKRD
jgi:hypothetical protein